MRLDLNAPPSTPTGREVPRLHAPDLAEFRRRHLKPKTPVILTGVASQWPAFKKWDIAFLRRTVGDNQVPIFPADSDNYPVLHGKPVHLSLGEYLDGTGAAARTDTDNYYLAQLSIERYLPELNGDFSYPGYLGKGDAYPVFWLSREGGSHTNLHFDTAEVLFAQILGSKEVWLFPPGDYRSHYPHPRIGHPRISAFNPFAPDTDQFPDFPMHAGYHCRVEPGEMLYIPFHWWHHVRAGTQSISVSFFYRPRFAWPQWFHEKRTDRIYDREIRKAVAAPTPA